MNWVQRWDVVGSTGNHYTVAKSDKGEFGCSCPAWKFQRKECKHIQSIKAQVAMKSRARNSPIVEEPRGEGKWYL